MNYINEDLRSVKTKKALHKAMFSLLKSNSFKKITIKKICEEAFISRAAFYTHFIDKYDLLKHWMTELWPKDFYSDDDYSQLEQAVNCYVHENMLVFNNLLYDADHETFEVLFEFMLSGINLKSLKSVGADMHPRNIVLSNFYAGGMIYYLLWQAENKFPPDVPLMNKYLYEMIGEFQHWTQEGIKDDSFVQNDGAGQKAQKRFGRATSFGRGVSDHGQFPRDS